MAALNVEKNCMPEVDFEEAIKFEREHSAEWDGKTVQREVKVKGKNYFSNDGNHYKKKK